MHSPIRDYFNSLSDMLAAASALSAVGSHRGDIGGNREDVLLNFLNTHLPRRLEATLGGQVLGLDGSMSGQIDIIVTNDIGIRFNQNRKTFTTAESVAACISIKSTLNTATLTDALNNLLSVPDPSEQCLSFPMLRNGSFASFLMRHPTYSIFAYDGMSGESCMVALIEHFNNLKKPIPLNRMPRYIIVNKKYVITFNQNERTDEHGTKIPANQFHWANLPESHRGYPLSGLVSDISHYESWLNHMDVSTHQYFNAGYSLPTALV